MSGRRSVPGFGQVWEGGGEIQSLRDWTLPFPVPYRTFGYFVVAELVMIVLRHVWVLQLTVSWMFPWIAYGVAPIGMAIVLTMLEPHGRPASKHLWALIRHQVAPRSHCLGRSLRPVSTTAVLDGVTVVANASAGQRVITGPITAELPGPVTLRPRGKATWVAQPVAAGGPGVSRIELGDHERLIVKR